MRGLALTIASILDMTVHMSETVSFLVPVDLFKAFLTDPTSLSHAPPIQRDAGGLEIHLILSFAHVIRDVPELSSFLNIVSIICTPFLKFVPQSLRGTNLVKLFKNAVVNRFSTTYRCTVLVVKHVYKRTFSLVPSR